MKPAAIFSALFLIAGAAAHAQWRLLPQLGIENQHSSVKVNGQEAISSLCGNSAFKTALRADYLFKGGHGPYASIGNSPSATRLSFSDPANLVDNYTKATSGQQWRLEGGYGVLTKPIYFKKGAAQNRTSKISAAESNTRITVIKRSCGSDTYSYHCQRSQPKQEKNAALNMRLQPSIGMAYLPGVKESVAQDGNAFVYRAGNWNTGLVSSLGFEFAKGARSFLSLQLSYTKGLGNLDTRTLTKTVDGKTSVTTLRSTASTWALTAGVPLSLTKRAASAVKSEPKQETKKCGSSYKGCHRTVI